MWLKAYLIVGAAFAAVLWIYFLFLLFRRWEDVGIILGLLITAAIFVILRLLWGEEWMW